MPNEFPTRSGQIWSSTTQWLNSHNDQLSGGSRTADVSDPPQVGRFRPRSFPTPRRPPAGCRCRVLNCGNSTDGGRCTVTDTVLDAASGRPSSTSTARLAAPQPPAVLPSERLVRLAELAAAATDRVGRPGDPPDRVCRSRPSPMCWPRWTPRPRRATKAAYRSDWARFTSLDDGAGVRPVAGAAVGGGALRDGGGGGADVGGEVAVHPGHVDPVGVVDQPVPHRRRAGRPRAGGGGPPGAVRGPADPGHPTDPAVTVAARGHPDPAGADVDSATELAGRGRGAAGHGVAVDGVRRCAPPRRARRPDPGRCHPAPDGRSARPAPVQQDRSGGPRPGEGVAVWAGPGHLPALRLRPVAGGAARLGHRDPDGGGRRAVLPVLRRQAATTATVGEGRQPEAQHCCRERPAPGTGGSGASVVPDRCTRPGRSGERR